MHIGIATVTLRIPENDNLKGKRRIVHSIASRARSRFNVAIAEVGENESWQTALLGIVCVSNDRRHANRSLWPQVHWMMPSIADLNRLGAHEHRSFSR
ncbi:MAG: DUF503 domain-containing protein [Chloroflexi bacterium]|nr:DUF503 domain-containing protein [Chloroflexota bacterium]